MGGEVLRRGAVVNGSTDCGTTSGNDGKNGRGCIITQREQNVPVGSWSFY
jgi:hypothetical protein